MAQHGYVPLAWTYVLARHERVLCLSRGTHRYINRLDEQLLVRGARCLITARSTKRQRPLGHCWPYSLSDNSTGRGDVQHRPQ